jgi:predicted porin
VTISGALNFDLISNGKVTTQTGDAGASVNTSTSQTGAQDQWTTGQVVFSGEEDLGGGLKASFIVSTANNSGALGARDTNVALSGGFGTARIGRFVPAAAAGFHGFSGAGTTSIGSNYQILTAGAAASGLRFSTTNANADSGTAGNMERNNNQIQYTSPSFNGLTVNVSYGTNSTDVSNLASKAEIKQQGISLAYANGPLSVGIGTNDRKVNAEGANDTVRGNNIKADLDWIGASYDLGVAKISASRVTRKDVTSPAAGASTTNNDVQLTSFGVSVPMGAITLAANVYTGKNARTDADDDNAKLSGHQVSVRYALSKRTTMYALIGEANNKRAGGNTTGVSRKETGTLVGLLHTF